jgi:putative ATP-grasp target RiPP
MEANRPSLAIEDLPVAGTELTEDELAKVAGGTWCVCVRSACSSAFAGG